MQNEEKIGKKMLKIILLHPPPSLIKAVEIDEKISWLQKGGGWQPATQPAGCPKTANLHCAHLITK